MAQAPEPQTSEEVRRRIREAGERARAEAEARKAAARDQALPDPSEVDGRGGLDPVRHGDWEINGVATDF